MQYAFYLSQQLHEYKCLFLFLLLIQIVCEYILAHLHISLFHTEREQMVSTPQVRFFLLKIYNSYLTLFVKFSIFFYLIKSSISIPLYLSLVVISQVSTSPIMSDTSPKMSDTSPLMPNTLPLMPDTSPLMPNTLPLMPDTSP